MKVVVHEAVTETVPVALPRIRAEQPEKGLPVIGIYEDRLTVVATLPDVVYAAGQFRSGSTWHLS